MSLVNRMLRDLEERQAFAGAPPHEALGGLQSAQEYAHAAARGRLVFRVTGSLIILAGAFLYLAARPAQVAAPAVPSAELPAPGVAAAPLPPPVSGSADGLSLRLDLLPHLASRPASDAGTVAAPAPDVRVLYLDHESTSIGADIVLALTGSPDYVVDVLEAPHRLRLDLRNAKPAGDLAAGFAPAGILSGVRHSAGPDGLAVVFDLAAPVTIDAAEVREGGDHKELHIRLSSLDAAPELIAASLAADAGAQQAAQVPQAPVVVKRPVGQEAPARDAFREGIAASRNGDVAGAIALLHEALSANPGHLEARRALVALLVEQGDPASAKRLALEGLEAYPSDPALLKAYTRLLLEDGETDSAVALLMRSPPALEADPDYWALTAAALQRQGRHPQSAEIYARLVRVDGARSDWWAGLGISLDALGRNAEALQAFHRVQRDAQVPVALRRYVSERIAALSGGAG